MRSMRQRLSVAAIAAGLTTMALGLGAGLAQAATPNGDCFSNAPDNPSSLSITTQPAAGSNVPAGTSIQVTGHWDSSKWAELKRMATCVTTNGNFAPTLGSVTVVPDQGINTMMTSVTLPGDLPVGTEVCIHDVLHGGRDSTSSTDVFSKDTSSEVCFHSAAAPVTTTSAAPTTTTTVAPTTTTVVTDSSGAGAGGPATPGEQVQGAVASNPAPAPTGELPRTGSGSEALAGIGGLAVGLGVLTLALGRRRTVRA